MVITVVTMTNKSHSKLSDSTKYIIKFAIDKEDELSR